MATTIPDHRRYTPSHLWVEVTGDLATVGLTERGVERHGKILFVGLPALDAPVEFGFPIGYLQSAGYGLTQLFPPVQGVIAAVNTDLWADPDMLCDDPLDEGWIVRIQMSDPAELEQLETAEDYRAILAGGDRPDGGTLPSMLLGSERPVFLIDERRRVLTCNPAAEAFIGLTRKQLQHQPVCQELFGCHHGDETMITKSECPGLCSMLNREAIVDAEYQVTGAAGGEVTVKASYEPLVEPGLPLRAVVTLTPVE